MPGDRGGRQATATCAMCGIELPAGAMVPDGGNACADVRWYCRDTGACTRRWTQRQPGRAVSGAGPGDEPAERGDPAGERAGRGTPGSGHVADGEPGDEPAERPVTGTPGAG